MKTKIEIIEENNRFDFTEKLESFINDDYYEIKDIKFAVTPRIHSGISSSYSSGERYYAMIMYEKRIRKWGGYNENIQRLPINKSNSRWRDKRTEQK